MGLKVRPRRLRGGGASDSSSVSSSSSDMDMKFAFGLVGRVRGRRRMEPDRPSRRARAWERLDLRARVETVEHEWRLVPLVGGGGEGSGTEAREERSKDRSSIGLMEMEGRRGGADGVEAVGADIEGMFGRVADGAGFRDGIVRMESPERRIRSEEEGRSGVVSGMERRRVDDWRAVDSVGCDFL
jgi:hypothetical protein